MLAMLGASLAICLKMTIVLLHLSISKYLRLLSLHMSHRIEFFNSLNRPVVQGYPDGCQQLLLRLRPYFVRGHRLLWCMSHSVGSGTLS